MVNSRELERAIAEVRERIAAAASRSGRDPGGVRLIGATKKVSFEAVRRAAEAGLTEFGENYVQELERKRSAAPEAVWHFIGRLQTNKARRTLEAAHVVQTLEPGRASERLAAVARERGVTLDCLVEVDFAGSRVGVAPDEAVAFAESVATGGALRVIGVMTVPPLGEPPRRWFSALREIGARVRERVETATEVSMGMSSDYEEAVEEGATMVRVGTAIFGPRA